MISPTTTTFRDSVAKICPPWLRNTWGERFMYSIAVQLDIVSEALLEGVKARMPGVGTTDALPAIGADRVIERGFEESDDAYAARLSRAFDDWSIAGSPVALIMQLVGYVSPVVPLMHYVCNGIDGSNGHTVATYVTITAGSVTLHRADPNNWDWDGDFSKLARFWILMYAIPSIWTFKKWGDGHFYNDGTTWGSSAVKDQARDVRRIVQKWKRAGSSCERILICSDATQFDPSSAPGYPMPDGTFGVNSKNVGGVQVRTRTPNVLYWKGTG